MTRPLCLKQPSRLFSFVQRRMSYLANPRSRSSRRAFPIALGIFERLRARTGDRMLREEVVDGISTQRASICRRAGRALRRHTAVVAESHRYTHDGRVGAGERNRTINRRRSTLRPVSRLLRRGPAPSHAPHEGDTSPSKPLVGGPKERLPEGIYPTA